MFAQEGRVTGVNTGRLPRDTRSEQQRDVCLYYRKKRSNFFAGRPIRNSACQRHAQESAPS